MRFELDIEPVGASVVGRLCSADSPWRTFAGRIELLAALDAAFEATADHSSEPTETGDLTCLGRADVAQHSHDAQHVH